MSFHTNPSGRRVHDSDFGEERDCGSLLCVECGTSFGRAFIKLPADAPPPPPDERLVAIGSDHAIDIAAPGKDLKA